MIVGTNVVMHMSTFMGVKRHFYNPREMDPVPILYSPSGISCPVPRQTLFSKAFHQHCFVFWYQQCCQRMRLLTTRRYYINKCYVIFSVLRTATELMCKCYIVRYQLRTYNRQFKMQINTRVCITRLKEFIICLYGRCVSLANRYRRIKCEAQCHVWEKQTGWMPSCKICILLPQLQQCTRKMH